MDAETINSIPVASGDISQVNGPSHHDVEQTLAFLNSICKDEGQRDMLKWMAGQPKEQLFFFLRNTIHNIPRESLAGMVSEQMPTHDDQTKLQVYEQVVKMYDFLSNPGTGQ